MERGNDVTARPAARGAQVEQLPVHDFAAHLTDKRQDFGESPGFQARGVQEFIRPDERQVSEEHGGTHAVCFGPGTRASTVGVSCRKSPVGGGLTATRVAVIHDVVVHKCENLKEFETRGCADCGLDGFGRWPRGIPPVDAQDGPQPFAAGQKATQGRGQVGQFAAGRGALLRVEKAAQDGVHPESQRADLRYSRTGQRVGRHGLIPFRSRTVDAVPHSRRGQAGKHRAPVFGHAEAGVVGHGGAGRRV
jgi:hypothetical protein